MGKTKILILQDTLSSYNEQVYKILSEKFNLTLAFANKIELKNTNDFKLVKLERFNFLNVYYFKNDFYKFCNEFDVVIFSADLHYFSFCVLPFLPKRTFKTVAWTIGIRASYKLRYNLYRKKNLIDYLYGIVLKNCDALIFYMDEPINFWDNFLNPEKIFLARNTIEVKTELIDKTVSKNTFLFVGTLYKEKKIYELLNAFLVVSNNNRSRSIIKLEIIGDGEEFDNINDFIKHNNLENLVILRGKISCEFKLSEAFNRAILCISPDQAGLSVLMSMGYGVPFVTKFDAITGGERLNIIDGVNGILYKDEENLIEILNDSYVSQDKYFKMGKNAHEYYIKNATIDIMANGFLKAIEYVTNNKP